MPFGNVGWAQLGGSSGRSRMAQQQGALSLQLGGVTGGSGGTRDWWGQNCKRGHRLERFPAPTPCKATRREQEWRVSDTGTSVSSRGLPASALLEGKGPGAAVS